VRGEEQGEGSARKRGKRQASIAVMKESEQRNLKGTSRGEQGLKLSKQPGGGRNG
jgi:hypothetical protein